MQLDRLAEELLAAVVLIHRLHVRVGVVQVDAARLARERNAESTILPRELVDDALVDHGVVERLRAVLQRDDLVVLGGVLPVAHLL